ncbi:hypothetical protein Unana1_03998 [Umbelopsis nana]
MTNTLDSHPFQNVFKRYKPSVLPPAKLELRLRKTKYADLCIAANDQVLVFDDDPSGSNLRSPTTVLKNPNQQSSIRFIDSPYKINALKVGFLGDEEILVSVAENGDVCVWRTAKLHIPPILLRNNASTWGIAIHANQRLIAVCANSFQITVFNMSMHPSTKQENSKGFVSILGSDSQCRLSGHEHNIPNIDFSECGRYIVSCSIDRQCRVWDLKKRKTICQRRFADLGRESDSWGWTAKFVSKSDFKSLFCDHEPLRQAMKERPSYGKKALGLSYFGIQHTAGAPLFLIDSDSLDFDMGGFNLDGADDSYDDFEEHLNEDVFDWENEGAALLEADYLDGVTPQDESDQSERSSNIDVEEIYDDDDDDEDMPSPHSLRRSQRSSHSSGQSTPHDDSRYGVESAQEYLSRQQRQHRERLPRLMSARAAASLRRELRLSAGRRESPIQHHVAISDNELETEEAREMSRSARTRQFLTRAVMEQNEDTLQLVLMAPTGSSPTATNDTSRLSTPQIPIEVAPGGWSSDDESVDDEMISSADENNVQNDQESISAIYPDAIPRPFTSHNIDLEQSEHSIKTECVCDFRNQLTAECMCPAGNDFPDQLVMLTTGRNVYLMDPKERMKKLAVDKNILADIDLRTDRLLCMMDRLNFVEWIPELELFIVASQKGMVALVRLLRIDLGDGEEEYIFNREAYLPHAQLHSSPLYGRNDCKET